MERSGTAVVTGGNRGIGLELVRQLAASGMTVILGSRDLDRGIEAAAELDGTVLPRRLDVTNPTDVRNLADDLNTVDVLINNAGIHFDTWQDATDADLGVVLEAFQTNVLGAWATTAALLPLMRPGSRIVNLSSKSGSFGETDGPNAPAYSVSKAALDMFTVKLATAVRDRGILVNAVCPGWVATDLGGPGGAPVQKGAASVLWAVDLPPDGPSGGFFRHGEQVPW
ncbi:SDR family NAD(P)-dependent oxidoreductase [Phycicoccus sp. CSK15P-2]|uniref:SDR family NAD(P)-dependent oxidoreductase n=1 Tax=Phycicoccus sp. CSK15P-2 TaxID=2807627 RepID=UPI00194F6D1E|nr:SDR family NAD(P)-dependent oxidoreductase [Phycicoccus sp. CSK15P-2]MBM6402653.1 SDR family NAD(P)-dependent oxidoreductase [Phycicoccus sp. CSK15P-2]